MLGIREQTGRYPREALEDIVLHWDMIDEKYGVGGTAGVELMLQLRDEGQTSLAYLSTLLALGMRCSRERMWS